MQSRISESSRTASRANTRQRVADHSVLGAQLGQRLMDVYKLERPPSTISEFVELVRARNESRPRVREFIDKVRAGKAVIGECADEHGYSVVLANGRDVKVMCAYDALMSSVLQGQGVVQGICPHCGEKTEVQIHGNKISKSSSSSIVFWWGRGPRGEPGNPVCDHLHLFPSREHLSSWLDTRPEELGFNLSLLEALELFAQFY